MKNGCAVSYPKKQPNRIDRPGYKYRLRADGSRAQYWAPQRAIKQAPKTMPVRRIPEHIPDEDVSELCQRWTRETLAEIAEEAQYRKLFQRRNVGQHLAPIYKKRAGCNGWACTIDAAWIERRLAELGDRCEVSGIEFDYSSGREERRYHKHPMRPSMDRIDNKLGYTPGNIRVVLLSVNVGINEWGLDHFLRVCCAIAETKRKGS